MKLPREVMEARYREFGPQIQEIALRNSLVKQIIDMYVYGDIITHEECLCRMVVELANSWDKSMDEIVKLHLHFSHPSQL